MNVTLDERLLLILGKMTVTDHEVAEAEEVINNPNFAIEQFFRLMNDYSCGIRAILYLKSNLD